MADQMTGLMTSVPGYLQSFRETRLSTLRPLGEMFDHNRISRPQNMNEAVSRISHNTRIFSGNYSVVVILLALYAILTNPRLLFALFFLFGGFILINRFGADPIEVQGTVVTQKGLYTALFCIGIPLLFFASPFATFFYIVGSSTVLILGHAALIEPSVESQYQGLQSV
ncbi:prenylated rab acceptor PRA1 [Atractiella rhizophila]|nr:prenylated rab acceptor PRA1 [Atractiella rhizophila]